MIRIKQIGSAITLIGGVVSSAVLISSIAHRNNPSIVPMTLQATPSQSSSHVTPLPIGSGNVNDSSTWLTYTHTNQWRISYPPLWQTTPDQEGNGVEFTSLGFEQDDDLSTPYGRGGKIVYSIFGQTDTSVMFVKNGAHFPSDDGSETFVVTGLKHFKIDAHPAIEFDYYPTDNHHLVRTRISIQQQTQVYTFTATYADESGKSLFERMMRTFKFIPV